jgi:hypothetical protein
VNHHYDSLEIEEINRGKIVEFVRESISAADRFKRMPRDQLVNRCQQAAAHNQELLLHMRQQWPADFAAWWPTLVERIR